MRSKAERPSNFTIQQPSKNGPSILDCLSKELVERTRALLSPKKEKVEETRNSAHVAWHSAVVSAENSPERERKSQLEMCNDFNRAHCTSAGGMKSIGPGHARSRTMDRAQTEQLQMNVLRGGADVQNVLAGSSNYETNLTG